MFSTAIGCTIRSNLGPTYWVLSPPGSISTNLGSLILNVLISMSTKLYIFNGGNYRKDEKKTSLDQANVLMWSSDGDVMT